jgi:hypothetical protein
VSISKSVTCNLIYILFLLLEIFVKEYFDAKFRGKFF